MFYRMITRYSRKLLIPVVVLFVIAGCGGGSGGGGARTSNELPSIQLDDGDVLGNGSSVVRIPVTDDTGIASVTANVISQGRLAACENRIDLSLARDSLFEACVTGQLTTCAVDFFIPSRHGGEVVVYPPPLYAPVGIEYQLSFVDLDGAATDPVNATFCFDVGVNAPPAPAADTYQLVYPGTIQRNGVSYDSRCEKQPGSDGVLANDDDDEHITNSCLRAELLTGPRFATNIATFANTFRADGGFRYEGLTNAPTTDSFTYRVSDGVNPPSAPITVSIVFSGDNSPPIAVNDSFTVDEDSDVQAFNVLTNDSDPDALPLSITDTDNGPSFGTATIRNGVVIEYQPNAGFSGIDRFDYVVTDSAGIKATATVEVTVTPVNDPPVAVNDEVSTDENIAITVGVLANDTDPEGDAISVVSVGTPTNGTAVVSQEGTVTYTPNSNYSGIDSFEYTISDTSGATGAGAVRVQVNLVNVAPQPVEDFVSTNENQAVLVNVLENDIDNDGDVLEIVEIEQPVSGSAELVDAVIRYTPAENFNGTDTFRYRVSDSYESAWAPVKVSVDSINLAPDANNDTVATNENTALQINVLANDTDPDGDTLTFEITGQPANGSAVLNAGGVLYTPAANFDGTDRFTYEVKDPAGLTDSASVIVTVSNSNVVPAATNDQAATSQGSEVTIDVLANDNDPDGDTLSIQSTTQPANGTSSIVGDKVVYAPDSGFSGTDSFGYTIVDADGATAAATVSLAVSAVNSSPVAVHDSVSTPESTAISIAVLANDTDADSDSLTIDSVTNPANGSASIVSNAVLYTPNANYSGTDSFNYTVEDGNGGSDTGSVTITVTNVNVAPVAKADSAATDSATAISIDVLNNDTDADSDTLSIVVASVTQPGGGTAAVSNGKILYTPNGTFTGADTFSYAVTDGTDQSTPATVTVTVTAFVPPNTAPVAAADSAATDSATAKSIDVLNNDTDADSDTLSIVVASVTQPGGGTAAVSNGKILYTPNGTFTGADTFSYAVTDGTDQSTPATVTVTVTAFVPPNTAPVAAADSAATDSATAKSIDVLNNDTDADSDTLSIVVASVTQPGGGTAAVSNGKILYTPNGTFTGADTFNYVVTDGTDQSTPATVTVTVTAFVPPNTAPVAAADSAATDSATAISIDVLNNDTDADSDTLSIVVASVTQPGGGTAAVSNGKILYTPNGTFTGADTFSYAVTDGTDQSTPATVTVTVTAFVPPNTAPVAAADSAATDSATAKSIDVLNNDTDADSDTLSIVVASVTQPGGGTAAVSNGKILYTPNGTFTGADTFNYVVTDGTDQSTPATVSVTVTAFVPPNTAPIAVADNISTDSSTRVSIDVLANDTDADSDVLSIVPVTVTQPANGSTTVSNGEILYTPNGTFAGDDTFSYAVTDGTDQSNFATVTITVTAPVPPNTAPVAVADNATTDTATAISIDVLSNDTDFDSDALSIVPATLTQPTGGTVAVANGEILYTPDGTFTGEDTFSYAATDGTDQSNLATVTVTVSAAVPVAIAGSDAETLLAVSSG